MKANRPLGGITYADTRPPACETCAHPRDRDSGGIVGAVASRRPAARSCDRAAQRGESEDEHERRRCLGPGDGDSVSR